MSYEELNIDVNSINIPNQRILVKMQKPKEKLGSLYLPESSKENENMKANKGILVRKGQEAFERIENPPQEGEEVYLINYTGTPFKVGDDLYRLTPDVNVLFSNPVKGQA